MGLVAGAVLALRASGALVAWLGSRWLTAWPGRVLPWAARVGGRTQLSVLVGMLALFGAGNSAVNIGMTVQAIATEPRHGRPILAGLNAMFSLGTVLGAAAGALAAAGAVSAAVSAAAHFTARAVLLASIPQRRHLQPKSWTGRLLQSTVRSGAR